MMWAPRRFNASSSDLRASRLIALLAAKLFAVGISIFVLLGLLAPNLVDMHDDVALVGALISVGLALALAGWGVRMFLRDRRKIAEARRRRLLPPLKEHTL